MQINTKSKRNRKYDDRKQGALHFGWQVAIGAVIIFVILIFLFGFSRVDGVSMETTLHDRQVVCYPRVSFGYEPGDVVAIKMPSDEFFVKRVVAVGGDVVDVRDGKLYVNDVALTEPYAQGITEQEEGIVKYPYTVDDGKYFVVGDNREHSIDSRSFGAVLKSNIKGKLLFVK